MRPSCHLQTARKALRNATAALVRRADDLAKLRKPLSCVRVLGMSYVDSILICSTMRSLTHGVASLLAGGPNVLSRRPPERKSTSLQRRLSRPDIPKLALRP